MRITSPPRAETSRTSLLRAEIELLRLKNELLRAEEARLSEEKRMLLLHDANAALGLPFARRTWSTYDNEITSFDGQMNELGLAHGWGTAVRANGDVMVGNFDGGLAEGTMSVDSSDGILLSRFADDHPVGVGIAWSRDRQTIARLMNGTPNAIVDSLRSARLLVEIENLGDVALDLLSRLTPPLHLPEVSDGAGRHHTDKEASLPPGKAPSAAAFRLSDAPVPSVLTPEMRSPPRSRSPGRKGTEPLPTVQGQGGSQPTPSQKAALNTAVPHLNAAAGIGARSPATAVDIQKRARRTSKVMLIL